MPGGLHFWLRDEVKPGEKRTPVLPEHAKKLIEAGHTLTVEASNTRCVPASEYQKVGCAIVPSGTWKTIAPINAIILGLKELDVDNADYPLVHRHAYFGHCYKNQTGWKELLLRFLKGNGVLLDLEFLTYDNGARVAAFGRSAGFIGMAVGLMNWCHQQTKKDSLLPSLDYFDDFAALTKHITNLLAPFERKPKIVVIGALGRCGRGATALAELVGLDPIKWDILETKKGGPFPELLDVDIVVNCIYLSQPIAPFITTEMIQNAPNRLLSVVVDVSCDTSNPHNPLPIYNQGTTFKEPVLRAVHGTNPLDVVAIDHLPSLVPYESAKEFGSALIDHLIECDQSDVWGRVRQLFMSKTEPLRNELRKESQHIWVRDEVAENERRTPLTPQDARKLIEQGFRVSVERSTRRVFSDDEYAKEGCDLVETGSWKEKAPRTATILGLQGLPNDDQRPLEHPHIFFGYAFNQQSGWKELLTRFVEGGGSLIDLQYLVDSKGARLTTFTFLAGHIGMAIGILLWCHQQLHPQRLNNPGIKRTRSKENLVQLVDEIDKTVPLLEYIRKQLEKAVKITGHPPVPVVIGAKGKVGSGAVTFARKLGLQPATWTRQETTQATEHGHPALLHYDIMINAINLGNDRIAPFLTHELVNRPDRELGVIVDISCDTFNPNNPLPIYNQTTSFTRPALSIIDEPTNPLHLVAIQNLAALLPRESSIHFSAQLFPHLIHVADKNYPVWERALAVFKDKIKDLQPTNTTAVPVLQLPTDFPRPTGKEKDNFSVESQVNQLELALPASLTEKVQYVAKTLDTTLSTVLITIFEVLLHRLSAEDDFMLGILKSSAENFSSIYSIHSSFASSSIFGDLITRTHTLIKSQESTAIPFPSQQLLSSLQSGLTNFQVMFVDQLINDIELVRNSLLLFDLVLGLVVKNDQIQLQLIYRSDLFSEQRSREFLNEFEFLTSQVVENTNQKSGKYSLVTEKSKSQIPSPYEILDSTWEGPITEHFKRNALRLPDKVAVVHGNQTLTYKEVDEISGRLANYLITNGIKPEDPIFIYGHRNLSMVTTILGILRAGGAVSLMDPAYPSERIINCLKVAEPRAWLSIEQAGTVAQEIIDFLPKVGCNLVLTIPLPSDGTTRKFLHEYQADVTATIPFSQDSIAVVTFTSGSTGLPKAVLGRHGPLTHFYPWMRTRFSLSENDHFSMCSGISHDPLQRDIFTPFFLGATIHVPNAEDIGNPGQLAVWMKNHGITVTHLTPAMGQLLSETVSDIIVDSLRVSLFVGDKLTKRDVHRLRKIAPQILCVNMYGSTETQRAVSYYPVPSNEELLTMKEILPVGVGMKDVQLILINQEGMQAGVGELGEIYVRSPHLARGYRGLEAQTREKFTGNPFRSDDERDRLYRTGDLGRYKPDGITEVVGRVDNQVKIRGFRIELGEINTMLSHHPAVKENVPIVREDTPSDKRIVAYVVPHTGYLVPPGHELRRFLENKLPNYMIPSAFVVLKSLPLTPNGKINTGALPAPERMPSSRLDRAEPPVGNTISFSEQSFASLWKEMFPDINLNEPVNTTPKAQLFNDPDQVKIANIWSELLGVFDFGANDSFFDLGGHSLLATRLIFILNQRFGVNIPLDVLLKNPTVSGIASAISAYRSNPQSINANDTTLDLHKEVALDPLIKSSSEYQPNPDPKTIFLTGATGFLGAFLLHELLQQTKAKVYCLVREANGIDGKQRLQQHLKIHGVWNESFEDRINPVTGDLSQPLLGLTNATFQKLAETIDLIIHNAAIVHWIFPYEKLKPANVNGTVEVLRLAAAFKVKPVHYISTTSVYDSQVYRSGHSVLREDDLISHFPEHGGYGQSKWVAEQLMLKARERGVPTNIFRPGYISGSEVNGIWTTDDFLCRLIKGCIQLQCYPDLPNAKFDICSVDYVSKSVVSLSLRQDQLNKTFHITSDNLFAFNQFFESAQTFGYKLEKVPFAAWKSKLLQSDENALHPVMSVFSDEYPNTVTKPYKLDRSNVHNALKDTLPQNKIDGLLAGYFSYFIRSGFLDSPTEKNTDFYRKWVGSLETNKAELVTRTNRTK